MTAALKRLAQDEKSRSLLYVPNERIIGQQAGPRAAFEACLNAGELERYSAYPLLHRTGVVGSATAIRELLDIARAEQPSVVLLQHLAGSGFGQRCWADLRAACPQALLVYHEHDPYTPIRQPLPIEARAAASHADIIYTSGTGQFRRNFLKYGASDVRYSPQGFDPNRFHSSGYSVSARRTIVMIANSHRPRKPWRLLPGARERKQLVSKAAKMFGDRFAIYGSGWSGTHAKGNCNYSEQSKILSAATLSINWDHFSNEAHYYSDRWPISLVSGAVHVTTQHPGQEQLTDGHESLFSARTPDDLLALADRLMTMPVAKLESMSAEAAQFAKLRHQQESEFRRILFECGLVEKIPVGSQWLYDTGLAVLPG